MKNSVHRGSQSQPNPTEKGPSRRDFLIGGALAFGGMVLAGLYIKPMTSQNESDSSGEDEVDSGFRAEISAEEAQQLKTQVLSVATMMFQRDGYQGLRQSDVITIAASSPYREAAITLDYDSSSSHQIDDVNPNILDGFTLHYRSVQEGDDAVAASEAVPHTTMPIQATTYAPIDFKISLYSESSIPKPSPDKPIGVPETSYYIEVLPESRVNDAMLAGAIIGAESMPTKPHRPEQLMKIGLQSFTELAEKLA